MKMRHLLLAFACLPSLLLATELSPWLGRDFEFEPRFVYLHQSYNRINAGNHSFHHSAQDNFYTLSLSFAAMDYSAELESTLADTHKQRPAFDNARLTGRYRIFDDIIGDAFTLTPGITITQACKHSLHDISSFHHGEIESEFHVAAGKEFSCEEFWTHRFWGVAGLGIGDHGSPWIHADFHFEKNWWDLNRINLFIHTLWGLGNNNLSRHHFGGYGPIKHKSIDIGLRYSHLTELGLIISLEYARRIFARNFPDNANFVEARLFFPFSL
jgi:hypothetical protein